MHYQIVLNIMLKFVWGNPLLPTKFRDRLLFFNKKYNLIYGKLLKQITDTRITRKLNILYYKPLLKFIM